jgi:hypothetical protein
MAPDQSAAARPRIRVCARLSQTELIGIRIERKTGISDVTARNRSRRGWPNFGGRNRGKPLTSVWGSVA